MGLMEKALKYKRELNKKGKETLMDRIDGPADTDFLPEEPPDDSIGPDKQSPLQEKDDKGKTVKRSPDRMDMSDDGLTIEDDISPDDSFSGGAGSKAELLSETDLVPVISADEIDYSEVEVLDSTDLTPLDNLEELNMETSHGYVETPSSADKPAPSKDLPQVDDSLSFKDELAAHMGTEPESMVSPKDDMHTSMKGLADEIDNLVVNNIKDSDHEELPPEDTAETEEKIRHMQERLEGLDRTGKDFQDFMVLHEIGKEIFKSTSIEEVYDVVLFSIMGQIGAASASIMVPSPDDFSTWEIAESRGVSLKKKDIFFDANDKIFLKFIAEKAILDIENFKDDPESRDEFVKFVSIDTRLLSPVIFEDELIATVVLGDKITIGDYNNEEREFIFSLCEIAAIALKKTNTINRLKEVSERYKTDLDYVQHIEELQENIIDSAKIANIEEVINNEIEYLGIPTYAAFMLDETEDTYRLIATDREDVLGLRKSEFSATYDSPLVNYIRNLKSHMKVDNFHTEGFIKETFDEQSLNQMTHFWIFPYRVSKSLMGFLLIFRIIKMTVEQEVETARNINRLIKALFSYILNLKGIDFLEKKYIDNVELIFKRINKEIEHAKNMEIPLTVILFSIKNFKRYYNLLGIEETKRLIEAFENIIKLRLSGSEFSFRLDRNKILVILTGKNKKYAVPLANTIRNEILSLFTNKQMQLLITFLTAEFPEEGGDLYELLNGID